MITTTAAIEMLLFWTFYNYLAVTGCYALPVDPNGGPAKLPQRSLIILVAVATLLGILSFMAVIAYWNAAFFVACCARPTDVNTAGPAGSAARSVEANRRRRGPRPSGNGKMSAATASPSSMGRLASSTRPAQSAPVHGGLPIPKEALRSKLAAPVAGSR